VGGAEVQGATLGSTELTFSPGPIRAGEYRFSVGTAGSGTLVFQTILPALMLAAEPSRIVIEGGTHNNAAPPFDFLARTFVPLLERMGAKAESNAHLWVNTKAASEALPTATKDRLAAQY